MSGMIDNLVSGKFRKKPVVIDAIRWNGDNWEEIYAFTTTPDGVMVTGPHPQIEDYGIVGNRVCVTIETSEGLMTARQGDWIIKGVKGEFYPCKPDIFEATYERVDNQFSESRARAIYTVPLHVGEVIRVPSCCKVIFYDPKTGGDNQSQVD